jgi:hypothetical protein
MPNFQTKQELLNPAILLGITIFILIFFGIYQLILIDGDSTNLENSSMEILVGPIPYKEFNIYDPTATPPWDDKATLSGVEVENSEIFELVRYYMGYSSPENIDYYELEDRKIILFNIYWSENPKVLLATFRITREKAGTGMSFDCILRNCQI